MTAEQQQQQQQRHTNLTSVGYKISSEILRHITMMLENLFNIEAQHNVHRCAYHIYL